MKDRSHGFADINDFLRSIIRAHAGEVQDQRLIPVAVVEANFTEQEFAEIEAAASKLEKAK